MRVTDFDFELPEALIATTPASPRDHARLLKITEAGLYDQHVYDLPDFLKEGDVLVLNNTRVLPTRLFGMRGNARIDVTLHKRVAGTDWYAFVRPGKRVQVGDTIQFSENFEAQVAKKEESGEVLLHFPYSEPDFMEALYHHGSMPLPPYIRRDKTPSAYQADNENYQTIYAKVEGAVAAPTAGLHFTETLLEKIKQKGVELVYVTLHVGAGTFLPVKVENIQEHQMHAEYAEMSSDVAIALNQAREEGRRIIAVGTTSLRVLETVISGTGAFRPFSGDTSIFIYPGKPVLSADLLLTNFHLPRSTLFMLVSAFGGLSRMQAAYQHAITNQYRFFSYGDATLIEKCTQDKE